MFSIFEGQLTGTLTSTPTAIQLLTVSPQTLHVILQLLAFTNLWVCFFMASLSILILCRSVKTFALKKKRDTDLKSEYNKILEFQSQRQEIKFYFKVGNNQVTFHSVIFRRLPKLRHGVGPF